MKHLGRTSLARGEIGSAIWVRRVAIRVRSCRGGDSLSTVRAVAEAGRVGGAVHREKFERVLSVLMGRCAKKGDV